MDQAAKDRDLHLNDMKSPEMMRKMKEMEERKKQLEEIERQLGMFVDLGVRAANTSIQICSFFIFKFICNESVFYI